MWPGPEKSPNSLGLLAFHVHVFLVCVCVFLWFHDLLAKILFKTGCLHVLDGSQSLAIPEIVAIVFSPARHTPYLFVIAPQKTFINIHNV